MLGKRGLYEIIMTFFIVIVLVFAILFFLYINISSGILYDKVSRSASAPRSAIEVKDAVLACHKVEYLDERLMDAPCRAKALLGGYRIRQYTANGCNATVWNYTKLLPEENQLVPFVVTVEQLGGKRCLAALEVVVPLEKNS
jgi:hypothetical protein